MTTMLKIDLDEILEEKLQFGFTVPVPIDVSQLLEYGDDDWRYDLDLDEILASQCKAAIVISAEEVRREHPQLTQDQAWEIAQVVRDQTRDALEDFIGDTVWMNYPSERMKLRDRIYKLQRVLQGRDDAPFKKMADELQGLARLLNREDHKASDDPAICGAVAATLDDIDAVLAKEGGAA